jgi:hypothetical protein
MHKVIYMKPGSGFILDNRTNNGVKGPEHVRTPRHVRKASARGESSLFIIPLSLSIHVIATCGPRALGPSLFLTLLECNLLRPRGRSSPLSRVFSQSLDFYRMGGPRGIHGAHSTCLPLPVPRPIPQTYILVLRSLPKLYINNFTICHGVGCGEMVLLPQKQGSTWSGPPRTVRVQLRDSLTPENARQKKGEQIICFREAVVRGGVVAGSSPNVEPDRAISLGRL